MKQHIDALVQDYQTGQLSRREFLRRAGVLLGGLTAAHTLLVACGGTETATSPAEPAADTPAPDEMDALETPDEATDAQPEVEDVTATGEITTEMVTFAANGDEAPGYLARPTGDGPFPGVVVIQEWWGLEEHIQSVTERFAQMGFVALAPDLYRGEVAEEPDDARRLAMALERDQALVDIQGAANYLLDQAFVEPKRAGIVGFCLGGGLAMNMSYVGEDIGAVVVFYGGGVEPTDEDFEAVTAPVLGIYGEADQGIPVEQVEQWESAFAEFGKTNEMIIYPDAPHAFFNDTRDSYREEAAEDAWQRTIAWFQQYLS